MIPHTSEDYRLDFCKQEAKELRASGLYQKVVIRKKQPEMRDGILVPFGRIYVERKESINNE